VHSRSNVSDNGQAGKSQAYIFSQSFRWIPYPVDVSLTQRMLTLSHLVRDVRDIVREFGRVASTRRHAALRGRRAGGFEFRPPVAAASMEEEACRHRVPSPWRCAASGIKKLYAQRTGQIRVVRTKRKSVDYSAAIRQSVILRGL
jgi:hypothetical protein